LGIFVVVTGFDDGRQGLYAHSGKTPDAFFPYHRFLKDWSKTDRTVLWISPNERP